MKETIKTVLMKKYLFHCTLASKGDFVDYGQFKSFHQWILCENFLSGPHI